MEWALHVAALIDNFTVRERIFITVIITFTSRLEYTERADVHRRLCKKDDNAKPLKLLMSAQAISYHYPEIV